MKKLLLTCLLISFSFGFSQETAEEVAETSIVKVHQKCTAPKKLDTIWGYFYGKKSQVQL